MQKTYISPHLIQYCAIDSTQQYMMESYKKILETLIFGYSLSLLLPRYSIPVSNLVGDREVQKKDLANATLVFGVIDLWCTLNPQCLRSKIIERELGANDARRRCAVNAE